MKAKPDLKNRFAIIMAGGRGERFWPVSREKTPKQLLTLLGKHSFLREAVDRVLPLIAQSGRAMLRIRRTPTDELIPLAWDDGPPWVFRLEVGHVTRDESVSIDGALVRASERLLIREPTMILPSGYLVHAGRLARLDARGAFTLLAQLRGTGPITIPPGATGQLVDVLARSGVDPSDLPEELQFEIVANPPRPIVQVRADERGGAPALLATVSFDYDGMLVEPGAAATSFDRENRRLVRRDLAREEEALQRLTDLGFTRRWDFGYARHALSISPSHLPSVVRTLAAEGWRVEAEGRAFRPARRFPPPTHGSTLPSALSLMDCATWWSSRMWPTACSRVLFSR